MTKRFGFTLAEVLITLGIIGVVAAMTIPTLISNTNGAQFKSAYKKALSSLNQAVLMNVAMEDTDFSTLVADGEDKATDTKGSLGAMLEQRLQSATDITDTYFDALGVAEDEDSNTITGSPVLKYVVTRECRADELATGTADTNQCFGKQAGEEVTINRDVTDASAETWRVYALADGTVFGYIKDAANCATLNEDCIGFIDVNSDTAPNTAIACDSTSATPVVSGTDTAPCKVSNANVKDIYPVFFHGQTVEPANDAARTVLFGK